jgi:hypothetical protein
MVTQDMGVEGSRGLDCLLDACVAKAWINFGRQPSRLCCVLGAWRILLISLSWGNDGVSESRWFPRFPARTETLCFFDRLEVLLGYQEFVQRTSQVTPPRSCVVCSSSESNLPRPCEPCGIPDNSVGQLHLCRVRRPYDASLTLPRNPQPRVSRLRGEHTTSQDSHADADSPAVPRDATPEARLHRARA